MKHNATIIFIHGLVGLLVALRPFTFFYKRENPCGLTPFFYKRENPCGYAALRPFTSFYKRERILVSWFERTSFFSVQAAGMVISKLTLILHPPTYKRRMLPKPQHLKYTAQ